MKGLKPSTESNPMSRKRIKCILHIAVIIPLFLGVLYLVSLYWINLWVKVRPFDAQETAVISTCIVSCGGREVVMRRLDISNFDFSALICSIDGHFGNGLFENNFVVFESGSNPSASVCLEVNGERIAAMDFGEHFVWSPDSLLVVVRSNEADCAELPLLPNLESARRDTVSLSPLELSTLYRRFDQLACPQHSIREYVPFRTLFPQGIPEQQGRQKK